ncbi:MAG: NADH:ubiquinone reductase (Na(+)-transporting) subunit F [Chitinispirillaceae bacterium]
MDRRLYSDTETSHTSKAGEGTELHNIDINGGEKSVQVPGGSSLLSRLTQQGISVPTACGGRGKCGFCKVTVTEGSSAITEAEKRKLSEEQLKSNMRLSCQIEVQNDLSIEIPRKYYSSDTFRGSVVHKKALTHDIIELRIKLKQPDTISFIPGQYMQLQSAEYNGRKSVTRAYSLSSLPSERSCIDFMVRRVPNGICTTWIFDHLTEGQEVELSGPYGDFHLSRTGAPVLFIAGGSGMAPIWSMLRYMKEKKISRQAQFFFGAQSQKDLFYTDELRGMEKELPGFTFIPALSNEPGESDWKGERGLITEVVSRHAPDTTEHEAYLCGSPAMIDACVKVLGTGGMPEEKIYYDKFA